jgi:hypothetical protein
MIKLDPEKLERQKIEKNNDYFEQTRKMNQMQQNSLNKKEKVDVPLSLILTAGVGLVIVMPILLYILVKYYGFGKFLATIILQ